MQPRKMLTIFYGNNINLRQKSLWWQNSVFLFIRIYAYMDKLRGNKTYYSINKGKW